MDDPIQILMIEDNPGDARLIRHALDETRPGAFALTHADTLAAGLQRLASSAVDVVLLDLSLPDTHGLETVSRVLAAAPAVPIVVLTSQDDEELALRAIRQGAQDYLVKGQLDGSLLARAVRYAIERKQLSDQLQQTVEELQRTVEKVQRLDQIKDSFLAIVTHELRTPLQVIMGYTELLREFPTDLDKIQESLDIIHRSALDQINLVNNLLNISQLDAAQLKVRPEPTDLHEAIEDSFRMLRPHVERKGLSLYMDIPPDLPLVKADPDRLHQILSNLVGNAIKFTPDSGEVAVSVAREGKDAVRVSVRDTGVGIAPEHFGLIFERFGQVEQAQRKGVTGTGLGLPLSKSLVEMHGGRIWVESKPGTGTTFHFTLPTSPSP